MNKIDDYIDKAKSLNSYKSDLELGRALGFKGSAVSFWRVGKSHPSDDKMIELAKLADKPPLIALADLNIWRATGAAKIYYMDAKKVLEKVALNVVIFALTTPLLCQLENINNIYYGK